MSNEQGNVPTHDGTIMDAASLGSQMAAFRDFTERQEAMNTYNNDQMSKLLTAVNSMQQMLSNASLPVNNEQVQDPNNRPNVVSDGGTSGPPP